MGKTYKPTYRHTSPRGGAHGCAKQRAGGLKMAAIFAAFAVAIVAAFTFGVGAANADPVNTDPNSWKVVRTLDFKWQVPQSSSDNQTDDNGTLKITPTSNGAVTATLLVDYELSGNQDIPAGSLEIRIPKNVFALRDGHDTYNTDYKVDIPFVTNGRYTQTIEEDYIVLKNKDAWSGAAIHESFTVAYTTTYASNIIDSKTSEDLDLIISFGDQSDGPNQSLKTQVDTSAKISTTSKEFVDVFQSWQSEWGTEPTDQEDWWYAVFLVKTFVDPHANQPYKIEFVDTPQDGGKIAGYTEVVNSLDNTYTKAYILQDELKSSITGDTTKDIPSDVQGGNCYHFFAVVGYPVDTTKEEQEFKNHVDATVTPQDGTTYDASNTPTKGEADAIFPYRKITLTDPPGEMYLMNKKGITNRSGGIASILAGNNVEMLGYRMNVGALNFTKNLSPAEGEDAYSWGKEFTAELIDDAFYIADSDGKPRLLTNQDYEIQMVEPHIGLWTWEPDYVKGSYTETAYRDYANYPVITAYGKKSESGDWEELGTFKYVDTDSEGRWKLRATTTNENAEADTANASSYGRLVLKEGSGYTGVRFAATVNKGKTTDDNNGIMSVYYSEENPNSSWGNENLKTAIYIRLKPSDFVKERAQAASDAASAEDTSTSSAPKAQVFIDNFNTLAVYESTNGTYDMKTPKGFKGDYANQSNLYGDLLKTHDENAGFSDSMAHRIGTDSILEYKYRSVADKKATVKNDKTNQRVAVTYELTATEYFDADDNDVVEDLIAEGVYKPHNSGYFYDLLPEGMTIDEDSAEGISSYDYEYSLNNVNVDVTEIKQFPNYKSTGRTLVVFHVGTKDPEAINLVRDYQIYGTSWTAKSRLGVKFVAYYDWSNIALYGNELYNPMAFETDNNWIYGGKKNEPAEGDIDTDYKDALTGLGPIATAEDGTQTVNPDMENPAFLYAHKTSNINVTTAAATGLMKEVAGSGAYGTGRADDQDIIVPTAGTYNYRLMFTGEESKTGEIVLYDSLENLVPDPANHDAEDIDTVRWRGTFQSVDISQPVKKGADVKVYYTTKEGLVIDDTIDQDTVEKLNASDANVDNSDIWTQMTFDDEGSAILTDEEKAKITGLAFDLRKTTENEPFLLDKGDAVAVYVYMQAPTDANEVDKLVSDAEKTKAGAAKIPYVYNGVSMRNTLYGENNAVTRNSMITHDYTRVGLKTASAVLNIYKNVEIPEDMDEAEAAAFESQTYTVTVKDKDSNPYTGTYSLRDARSGYYHTALTEEKDLYVRVDSDTDRYYVLGRDYENNLEKVKYADETGNIYDESRGLDADGNPKPRVYSKRIKADPSAYTFEGHEDGVYDIKVGTTLVLQEVTGGVYWIVAETPGDYTTTYVYDAGDSVDGGTTEEIVLDNNVIKNLTFTNTPLEPTPVGKLSISKTVKTAREGGENDIFTFTVSLADADGNPVEGAFPVSSPSAEQADATAEEATTEEADSAADAGSESEGTDAAEATQEMLTFTEGQATVKLADGQTITISDLPADTFYTVEEEQPEGYEAPTATGDAGTIVADETQVAAFENNAKEEEPEPEPEPEEPAIEKYVNNDVHNETTYDGTIPYSILVSVPTDAESIEIRDRLDNQLVFADDEQTIAGTAVVKDENDHKAGGTVASAGTPITASATIDAKAKVLTVSVPDATSAQGKWIQVDFNAALDTTVVAVNDKLSVSKVTGNGEIDTAIEEHEGIPNNAEYRIAVGNSYEKYAPAGGNEDGWNPSNTVTTDIPTTSIAVDKTWVVGKSAVDWPTGATLTVQLTLDDAVATDSQGNAIECVLDEDNQEGTFTNLLALEQSTYGVAEVEVKDAPEGYTATVKETEGGFSITNTKEPEEPEEPEKPVIEKYVNNDVHQKLADITDTFTYDILAYVPADAAVVEITDTLDEQLTFADGADAQASAQAIAKTAVVKDSNNSTIGASGTSASTDGKSIEATAAIDGQTIAITIPDATAAQGKWVQVTIQAKAQDNAQVADLEEASQAITNNGTVKGGSTNHTGVPNTASYRIGVLVEPEDDGTDPKDGEEPAEPTIDFGKYGPEDGNKDGWNDSNTVTIIVDEPTPEPEPEPEPETAQVTITKVDATTNNTLAGATLRVYTADSDTPLAEWQSTLDGYAINLVAPGNYVIEETKAPSGYSVNAKASFTIAEDGTLALGEGAANVVANGLNIVVADPPADYLTTAETTIYKTWYDDNTGFDAHQVAITFKAQYSFDEETWYDLPHKTVTVTGEQKGANGEWTASFDQLPAIIDGKKVKWRAVETDAPDGYLNATSTVAGANGMIAKNFVNDGSDGPKGGISISKKALGGTDELPGATLAILDADGNEVLRWATTDRPHNFTLPAGASYTLRELEAPEGYALAEDIAFIITPEGDAAIQNGETVTVIDVLTMFDPKAPEPTPDPQPQPQPQPQPGQPTPNTPRTETKTTVTPTPAPTPVSPSTPTVARTTTAATADTLGITASALLSLAAFAAGCVQLSRRRKQD